MNNPNHPGFLFLAHRWQASQLLFRLARQAEWLVPLPENLSEIDAMTIGTAGFTAALCVKALEDAEMPIVDTYENSKKNKCKNGLVRL